MLVCTGDVAGSIALYESASEGDLWTIAPLDYLLGVTHTATGHPDRARPYLTKVASTPRAPDDPYAPHVFAAVALELLGKRAEALRSGGQAVRLAPEARDAVNAPQVAMLRAWVLIRSGERAEEGYAEFERLLGGFDLQPRWVAALPEWQLLREDARVQQIIRDKLPERRPSLEPAAKFSSKLIIRDKSAPSRIKVNINVLGLGASPATGLSRRGLVRRARLARGRGRGHGLPAIRTAGVVGPRGDRRRGARPAGRARARLVVRSQRAQVCAARPACRPTIVRRFLRAVGRADLAHPVALDRTRARHRADR